MNNKRKLFLLEALLCAIVSSVACGQGSVQEILSRVGDRILDQTSYRFIDVSKGSVPLAEPPVAIVPSVRIMSEYNDWNYFMGVVLSGMMRTADSTGNPKYRDYVLRNFRFIFDHLEYFREQWEIQQVTGASFYRVYRMNMLDDCGAMGAALAEAYTHEPDPRYLRMIQRIANYIRKVQLRLPDGTLSRPDPRFMTLWADDLYMSVPFLVRAAAVTSDSVYINDAVRQVLGFTSRLIDPETGLLRHAWFSATQEQSVAAWGRANGWAVTAQVELLSSLSPSHPMKDSLLTILRRHLKALVKYQDQSGLWHQVLDRQDSYLETSCSAMFCYGLARAVNRGWIDRSYANNAHKAWTAISKRVRPDGQIEGICRGTEVGFDLDFYYNRPTPLNDTRGIGAVLLAGSEMMHLDGNNR